MLDNYNRYELVVRPRGRTPADEYLHNSAVWIEGREGSNYTIDIRNNTHNRALFVISVDGLDVLEGKPAGLNSQGYVVPAYQTVSVPGWKLNNAQAAEFFFSRSRDSYVNEIGGSTSNTGVIGAMIFSEYQPIRHFNAMSHLSHPMSSGSLNGTSYGAISGASPLRSSKGTSMMTNSNASLLNTPIGANITSVNFISQDVGTGFGEATNWNTTTTQFVKANPTTPDAILAMYYNTAKNLEKMGIRIRTKRDISYQANPFPAYTTGCKPPPDWSNS